MPILLDECVPRRFRDNLPRHDVRTVREMGWSSLQNGELLAIAAGPFDVFVATDQRLPYQRSLSKFAIAVVTLIARRNKLEFLAPLGPELLRALAGLKPGEATRIGDPEATKS
ncbi:MAG TPA: hypothetical protein VHZ24_10530 [Pirellulales bacterium]|jgi:hypothetical protein|nr:hypothetical protein [Pirellulales bacterium]